MKKRHFMVLLLTLALLQLGMGRREGQYDEEARELERQEKILRKAEKRERGNPVRNIAGGFKQATYDSTADLISETEEATEENAVTGALEGPRRGSEKILDNTVKGAVKVATLGYGSVDSYEVAEPKKGSDEPTKIKIKIPGT